VYLHHDPHHHQNICDTATVEYHTDMSAEHLPPVVSHISHPSNNCQNLSTVSIDILLTDRYSHRQSENITTTNLVGDNKCWASESWTVVGIAL